MIVRELKLKLTRRQKNLLNNWLQNLTGVYNWAIRQIELNAQDKIYFSKFDFINLLSNHGKKIGIPSHTVQGTLDQAYNAWKRCFNKVARKPRLKSVRNKLCSIPFPDPIPTSRLKDKVIMLPKLGECKFHRQDIPTGQIKRARIVRRSSGWYVQLSIDTVHKFPVKDTNESVGIDTGFKRLAVLSNGQIICNPRNYRTAQARLAKAQRGINRRLVARLHERIKNRRKDYNHKISRKLIEDYKEIFITNDNLKGQSKMFGKSVQDAGIFQLRQFISYKGDIHGRNIVLIDSKNTTLTCSNCGAKSGPTGVSGLAVRQWECRACGAQHDRDINAAKVILMAGLGWSLDNAGTHAERPETSRLESSGGAR